MKNDQATVESVSTTMVTHARGERHARALRLPALRGPPACRGLCIG